MQDDHGSVGSGLTPLVPSPSLATGSATPLSEAQIKYMAHRFLGWRLPSDFHPDNGISFMPTAHARGDFGNAEAHWPVGTNLLDATQATAMVRHLIEGLGEVKP